MQVKLGYDDPETGAATTTTLTVNSVKGWYEADDFQIFPGIQHRYLSGAVNEQIAGFRRVITIDFGVISTYANQKAILYFLMDPDRTINLPISAPTGLAAGTATSGGSLTNGVTFYWRVTAVDATGETTGATEVNKAITAPNQTVPLTWNAVTGALAYRVYRSLSTGDYTSGTKSISTDATNGLHFIAQTTTNSYTDTGTGGASTYQLPSLQQLSVALANPSGYANEWLEGVQIGKRYVLTLFDQTLRTELVP